MRLRLEGDEARTALKSVAEYLKSESSAHHILKVFSVENLQTAYMRAVRTRDFETAHAIGDILSRL